MNITAIGGISDYTSLGTSQNIQTTGSTQSVSSGTSETSSSSSSQATSGSSSSSSTSGTSAVYDPEDLNQDGVVTYAEKMQYAMTHPLEAQLSSSSAVQSYNQQGQIESSSGASRSTINVYA